MKIIACIPARLASTRLPNKLLLPLGQHSVLATTYINTKATELFYDVIVICDEQILANEIVNIGGTSFLSKQIHETGTDRIAEFIDELEADIIINVQGDEPFVNKAILEKIILAFDDKSIQVATAKYLITEQEDINNPNFVKVVCDKNDNALFFSRSPIPYKRSNKTASDYYKHVGIYAFRKLALQQFIKATPSMIEKTEQLENLRLIEEKITTKVVTIDQPIIGIDTEEDYKAALLIQKEKVRLL
jgi:3-deoxy-manno-octulosonate cytidylyltransferase (CMP-KDO synthetase)